MNTSLTLSEAERTVLLDLLKTERDQLPGELHHTEGQAMQERLHARKKVLDELFVRITALSGTPGAAK